MCLKNANIIEIATLFDGGNSHRGIATKYNYSTSNMKN
jgi:hypothetical protein